MHCAHGLVLGARRRVLGAHSRVVGAHGRIGRFSKSPRKPADAPNPQRRTAGEFVARSSNFPREPNDARHPQRQAAAEFVARFSKLPKKPTDASNPQRRTAREFVARSRWPTRRVLGVHGRVVVPPSCAKLDLSNPVLTSFCFRWNTQKLRHFLGSSLP